MVYQWEIRSNESCHVSHVLVYLYSFRCCCTCQLSCSVYTFASVLSDIVRTHCTLYTICSSYLAVRTMFLRAYPIYVLATAALNALLILASSRNPQNRAAKYIFLSSKEAPAFPHMMYHRLNNTTSMIFLIKTSLILPPIVVPFPATFNTRRLTPPLSFFLPRIASAVATTAWTSPLRGTATNLRRLEEEATATAGGAGRGQPRRGGEAETW